MDSGPFDWLTSPAFHNQALTAGLWWFLIIWIGSVGGCLGSFFNVVWDRWGTGRGFVVPRSRCATCGHLIRWQHNLPIVGWLILGGRCYDCGTRISPKHAIVEAAFAALFMALAIATPWL